MSTGMANEEEIEQAVTTARQHGTGEVVLLHCVSNYPADLADAHVRSVPLLAERFGCPAGLSDHTLGSAASVAAVALGACVIEKHFTLARADGGPDAQFSLEPSEFTALVRDCKDGWRALGTPHLQTLPSEMGSRQFRRSLYVVDDIAEGQPLTDQNIRSIRPGHGLPPNRLWDVLGKTARRALRKGEALAEDMFQ